MPQKNHLNVKILHRTVDSLFGSAQRFKTSFKYIIRKIRHELEVEMLREVEHGKTVNLATQV